MEEIDCDAEKEWNPHAFHRHLPPHHMDDDGIPYVTKFAQHKARQIVRLALSINLDESLFVKNEEEESGTREEKEEEEEEEDDHAVIQEYTLNSVVKKCARLQSQLTTLEGLKHGGISKLELAQMVLHLLRLITCTVTLTYNPLSLGSGSRPTKTAQLHYDNVGYIHYMHTKTEEPEDNNDYKICSSSQQLDDELSQSFALPTPARESLLSALLQLVSKKDTWRAVSNSALFLSTNETQQDEKRFQLVLHWKTLLRMLLRTAPYLDEHKVGNPPTCSNARHNTIVKRTVHFIRQARQFFFNREDHTARQVYQMVRTDLLQYTHTHACYRGAILLYMFQPTMCSSKFYSDVMDEWFTSWSSIDRCPEFDFLWLVLFCRARKHVTDDYDWTRVRRRLLTHSQYWLHLPVGGSSMDTAFPRVGNPRSRSCPARLKTFVGSGSSYEEGIDFVAKVAKLLVTSVGTNPLDSSSTDEMSTGTADLLRFLSFVAPYFNPSNVGVWTFTLGAFLHYLTYELCHRVGIESSMDALQKTRPALYQAAYAAEPRLAAARIPPHEMAVLMHSLLPLCQQALYSKNGQVGRAGEASMVFLAQIDPVHVTPPFLDFSASALDFSAVNLSHQAPSALSALTRLVQPALRKNPSILLSRLPDILRLSLAGVDSNDQNKSIRTLIFYRNLTSWIPVVSDSRHWPILEASPIEVESDRDGMIHVVENVPQITAPFVETKEYLNAIKGLPTTSIIRQYNVIERDGEGNALEPLMNEAAAAMSDWALAFLDRIYDLLRASGEREKAGKNASGVASRHSSSDVQQARNFSRVLKECLMQVFSSMDDASHRTATRSVTQFLSEESLPSAAKDASYLCQAVAAARDSGPDVSNETKSPGLEALIPILLEGLEHSSKNTVIYRLRCLAGAVRFAGWHVVEHRDQITKGISFALASEDKDIYKTGCKLLRQTLASQCESYPIATTYSPKAESNNMPLDGDMSLGKCAGLKGASVHWHVPNGEQMDFVCSLLNAYTLEPMVRTCSLYKDSSAVIIGGDGDGGIDFKENQPISVISLRRCLRVLRYALRGGAGILLDAPSPEEKADGVDKVGVPHEQAVKKLLSNATDESASALLAMRGQICSFAVSLMSLVAIETADAEDESEEALALGQRQSSTKYRVSSDAKICKELSEIALLLLTRRGASFRCQEGKTIWRAQKQLATDFATSALTEHTVSILQRTSCYGDGMNLGYKDGEEGGKCLTRRLLVVRLQLFYESIQRQSSFEIPRRLRRFERIGQERSARLFSIEKRMSCLSVVAANRVSRALAGYEGLVDGLCSLSCHSNTHVRAAGIGVIDYAFTRFGWLARSRVSRLLSAISLNDSDMEGKYGIPSCAQLVNQTDSNGRRKRLAEVMKGVCSILALSRALRETLTTEESRLVYVRALCQTENVLSVMPAEEMQKMVHYFQNIFNPFRSRFFSLPRTTHNEQVIHETCLKFLLDILSEDTGREETRIDENDDKNSSGTKAELETHWRKRLLVGWFIMNFIDREDLVADENVTKQAWNVCFRLLEVEMGQPLQRVAVGLLGRLVSFLSKTDEKNVLVLKSSLGYLREKLLEKDFCEILGRALVFDHREDTSVAGGHDAQWSTGVEDILRDASRFVALRSMFPFQRTGQSSGTFKVTHAQLVESVVLLAGKECSVQVSQRLLRFAEEVANAPPSEDQRNMQVTSAEIFAGVSRAKLLQAGASDDPWNSELLDFLDEVIPKYPISLTGAYFDSFRYGIQSCSPGQMLPLASWLIGKVDSSLWKKEEAVVADDIVPTENGAEAGSFGTDGFTLQSKFLYLVSAIMIELDEESELLLRPAWYRDFLQESATSVPTVVEDYPEASWALVRDKLLPRLVAAVGHPYESCRDHIAGCLFRIWCCQQKIARQVASKNSIESAQVEVGVAGSLILQNFVTLHNDNELSFNERYNTLITARKFMSYCIHLGDAKREFSHLVVPLLPLAFEALRVTIDEGEKNGDEESASKRSLETEVAKGFRYMITEVGSACVASYGGGNVDITTILIYAERASKHDVWQVRQAAAHFLRCFQGSHKFLFSKEQADKTTNVVASLLSDERREVSTAAMSALTGILAATPLEMVTALVEKYVIVADRSKMKKKKKSIENRSGKGDEEQKANADKEKRRERNQKTSVFFLCATVLAQPYETPPYVPVALAAISKHSFERNAPLAVRDAVKKCCGEFKRTHMSDNWDVHRNMFSREQLEALEDVVSSPHYYA